MRHPRPRRLRSALVTAPLAIAPLLAAVLLTACGGGTAPGPVPVPAPAAPEAAVFTYAPGELHALFESRATVRVAGDTSAVSDTVVTRLRATLRLASGPVPRAMTGTVDSVTVLADRRTGATTAPRLPLPLALAGTVVGGTVRLSIPPDAAADCSSPAGAYLAIARDLLPSLPDRLTPGTGWSDTVATTSCRGGVVLTTTATHRYVVRDTTVLNGRPVTRIARTTLYRLAGRGSQAGLAVSVEGEGTGDAEIVVDVAAGELVSTTARSTLGMTFDAAGRVQRVVQEGVQSVTLSR